ncbi:MAG: hypothetical protein WBP58_04610 [Chitinophagaceae bacterium]
MSPLNFSEETLALMAELDKISTENIGVCRTMCIDNYHLCLNSGKDESVCQANLHSCYQDCYRDNPAAAPIIDKIIASLKK